MKRLLIVFLMLMVPVLLVSWLYSRPGMRSTRSAVKRAIPSPHQKHADKSPSVKSARKSPDEIPYMTLIRALGALGEQLMKNDPSVGKGRGQPSSPLSLLQSLLSPEGTKKAKSSKHRTSRKDSGRAPSGFLEDTRSSLMSRLAEIANDENGKMLLDLFQTGPDQDK